VNDRDKMRLMAGRRRRGRTPTPRRGAGGRRSWLPFAHLVVVVAAFTSTKPRAPTSRFRDSFTVLPRMMTGAYGEETILPHSRGEEDTYNPDDWYKRYDAYPPYCSTPAEMKKRAIPPLSSASPSGLTLEHVTVVVRHGARTPYAGNLNCWENYTMRDTGVWNCRLTTIMAPPSPWDVDRAEHSGSSSASAVNASRAQFLFEKRYDALQDPPNGLSNALNGTCQLGQLLLRGYEQEMSNGRMLRDAYLMATKDPRMKLRVVDPAQPWKELYYRADDDQRTLMSGEVLLRGLLGDELQRYYAQNGTRGAFGGPVVVPVHTADRARDVMDANENVCPRLAEIAEQWLASDEYRSFMNSKETQTLQQFARKVLKVENMSAVDCLMTTICTDRTLPDAVNDYRGPSEGETSNAATEGHPYGTDLFQRLFDLDAQSWAKLFVYDDASYSKLALTPVWRDILANINGATSLPHNASAQVCCPLRAPPTLAIFSGHDTTLMPLLASLGSDVYDGEWPPYASMMTIELYRRTQDQSYLFRLVYNGKVLTPRIHGCNKNELCFVSVLLEQVTLFTKDYDCARRGADPKSTALKGSAASSDVFSTPGGILALCLLVIGSALFGSLGTYLYVAGRPRRGGRQRLPQQDHDEDGISMHFSNSDNPGIGAGRRPSSSSLS
jgi:Histidine phosphatase superfamily (branch 2)